MPTLDAGWVVAMLEADPPTRALLDEAAAAALREDPGEGPAPSPGARAARAARGERALAAIDHLLLRGELVADGPGRLRLPGFGAATWRAIALLREGADPAAARWAAAVTAEPAADLGEAAPPFLRGPAPDPHLSAVAIRLHSHEAHRQDARDALVRASMVVEAAVARGRPASVVAVQRDCALLEARIRDLDREIAATWEAGARAALTPR